LKNKWIRGISCKKGKQLSSSPPLCSHFVWLLAVKMVVDNTSQIKHFEGAQETIKGMKRLMIPKEAERRTRSIK
jgi:hypothetical protein